jgi:hypothetical protein
VRSLLANALYSPHEDLALEFVGENVRLEWDDSKGLYSVATDGPIVVRVKPDYFKTRQGLKWYQPLDKKEFSRAPAGWCSWYYYYLDVDEAGILRNLDWLKEKSCSLRTPGGADRRWVAGSWGWAGR